MQSSVSQPPGRVPVPGLKDLFTGTWNIRETKNLSEITKKSSIFKDKVIRKINYRDNWPQTISYRDKRQKKSFYRDLDLKSLRTTTVEHTRYNTVCFLKFVRRQARHKPLLALTRLQIAAQIFTCQNSPKPNSQYIHCQKTNYKKLTVDRVSYRYLDRETVFQLLLFVKTQVTSGDIF